MMMGLGVVGAQYTNKSDAKLDQTTPIAKLIEEAGAIVVAKNSPYKTINELVTAWKANPKGLAVGGGSSPGGPDHLLPMQLAQTVGIDPKEVNFIAYDGGGDLLPAVLGGKVAFASSGYGEFLDQVEAGEVRVLAISGASRVDAVDAPTLKESGIDLEFTNWRGVVAPPELTDADKAALVGAFTKMHDTAEWKEVLTKNGWTDAFMTGDEFGTYMDEQTQARRGCADHPGPGMSEAVAVAGKTRQPLVEYVPCAFLALMGVIVLIDASTAEQQPHRGRPARAEGGADCRGCCVPHPGRCSRRVRPPWSPGGGGGGEDIDLDHGADVKTVLLLIGVFVANILLIDTLGWVISGGLLFYGSAIALGSRHFIRDLVIAAGLSLGTFYGFAIGLGVDLPAGILQGIL